MAAILEVHDTRDLFRIQLAPTFSGVLCGTYEGITKENVTFGEEVLSLGSTKALPLRYTLLRNVVTPGHDGVQIACVI